MSKGQKGSFVDLASNATIVIDSVHYNIHNGGHFDLVDIVDQSINAVRDIQITTPDTQKWAHMVMSLISENELEWFLYRNVNIILAGSAANVHNSNHNSAKSSVLVVKEIDNASVAGANADTAVAGATLIQCGITGTGQRSGSFSHEREIVLKQGEDYCLRFFAKTAGYVSYHVDWYEHENEGGDF